MPGEAAFHDSRGGYFDAAALALLIAAMCASSTLATALCVFLAAWTDERALIASIFVLLFAVTRAADMGKLLAAPAAWAAYLASRWCFAAMDSLANTSGGIGIATFFQQANAVPLGIWTGLGGCWILVGCAISSAILQKTYAMAACFCAALGILTVSGMAITDVTRTVAYCFPAVLAGIALLARSEPVERIEKLAMASALVSFVTPTYYVQGSTGFWWL